MAISAINNLKKIETTNDSIFKNIIKVDYDVFKSSISSFFRIFSDEDNPLFTTLWRILCMLGLLCYDLSEDQERQINCVDISSGIISLLYFHNRDSSIYPTDLINDILPNIDDIIESTLTSMNNGKIMLDMVKLYGIIKLIELHPSQDSIKSYSDRICGQYILNTTLQFNRFEEINSFEITDKRSVYFTAFLSYIGDHDLNRILQVFKKFKADF